MDLERGLLSLPGSEAPLQPRESGLTERQADPPFMRASSHPARGRRRVDVIGDRQSSSRLPAQVAYKETELPLTAREQWLACPCEELDHDGREAPNGERRAGFAGAGGQHVSCLSSPRRSTHDCKAEDAPDRSLTPAHQVPP